MDERRNGDMDRWRNGGKTDGFTLVYLLRPKLTHCYSQVPVLQGQYDVQLIEVSLA
jgi:hypothetical protein